ncbi:MAG: hypothetical protein GOVbin1629_5 [Prokaryotic dsDNA virus sp.]|nr:MAG: hypothetical protein GOVbin1629_5 [Prokaryotic dsDNA virus sp.]|tara:strand:+ start:98 stop:298 length:201 start_codon:yes stop_codon:yes gene_type:complete
MDLTDKELKEIDINDKIDNYVKWFREDCCDPYGELEWLIKTLLETDKHKTDMMDILNDTYELYKNN